jgi:hypothetical protein
MSTVVRFAPLLVVLALVLPACTRQEPEISANEQVPAEDRTEAVPPEGEGGGPPVQPPTWIAVDIAWDSAPTQLPPEETTVRLVNQGAAQHNLNIDELGVEPILEAPPGETEEATVTLAPGEYRYYCSVPGHESLMNGIVTVG